MIEFNDNKPIYRQILEYAFARIIDGTWKPAAMVPSVRELTTELGVNNRTVLKAMDELQELGIIEPKRGMGFLLAADAPGKVRAERRREFFGTLLPQVAAEMRILGITPDEVRGALDSTH